MTRPEEENGPFSCVSDQHKDEHRTITTTTAGLAVADNNRFASNQDFQRNSDPSIRETLARVWEIAVGGVGSDDKCANTTAMKEEWFQRLWEKHKEPGRHYHTAVHLYEMVGYFELLVTSKEDDGAANQQGRIYLSPDQQRAVLLSIFFHDAVYDASSSCNEEGSAKLFQNFADAVGLSTCNPVLTHNVIEYILATKTHQVEILPPALSSDKDNKDAKQRLPLALFLDLDLAVLGKTPAAYRHYAQLIRREYHFVPHATYCSKRAEILESLLSGNLFGTHYFRQALEEQARSNLAQEIELLKNNTIPGGSGEMGRELETERTFVDE